MYTSNKPTLEPGLYRAEQDGGIFDSYTYVLEAKETVSSYILKLVECSNFYANNQIEAIFGGKNEVVIPKNIQALHRIQPWSEQDFTIRPFRVGVPIHFWKEAAVENAA